MATFDAPEREFCVVRRSRTNTPLQAFVMIHDPQFVEAARQVGGRMIKEGGTTIEARIKFGFELSTARSPNSDEMSLLVAKFKQRLAQYRADPYTLNLCKRATLYNSLWMPLPLSVSRHPRSTSLQSLSRITHVQSSLTLLSPGGIHPA